MTMTEDQQQLVSKALQSGIPALAKEHIAALEEVVKLATAKPEELNGIENFQVLNQNIYENTIKTLSASYPFMAGEVIQPYVETVQACQAKFAENIKAREEREKTEACEEKPAETTEACEVKAE